MRQRLLNFTVWLGIALCCTFLATVLAFVRGAFAHDASHPHADWYKSQVITPEARVRMKIPFKSCCDAGDHFDTRFRLINDGTKYGAETYEYLARDGGWRVISPDIIQRKPTPDGKPVLFILKESGKEVCFIIDKEGI